MENYKPLIFFDHYDHIAATTPFGKYEIYFRNGNWRLVRMNVMLKKKFLSQNDAAMYARRDYEKCLKECFNS